MAKLRLVGAAALVLVAAVTLVLASAAASSVSPVTCGQTITADITLTKNLDCPGTGLVIGAGGLALDLGGHTISAAGRPIAGAPATIENGILRGSRPITVTGHGFASPARFLDVRIEGGLSVEEARVFMNDSVVKNGGLSLDESHGGSITNSVVVQNPGECAILAHESGGTSFENNDISHNAGSGLCAVGSVVRLINNKVTHNGGDGIFIFDREDVNGDTFEDNTASHNGGLGISMRNLNVVTGEEIPAVDLGGNVARHNGDARQCVALGLVCSQH